MLELARDVLALSREGLKRRAVLDGSGKDEIHFLEPIDVIAASGRTPAEGLLESFYDEWNGRVDPLFIDCMY